jgi:hypothetical protein
MAAVQAVLEVLAEEVSVAEVAGVEAGEELREAGNV